MNIKLSAALALLLVGTAACGDDTTDPTGGGGSSSAGGGEGGATSSPSSTSTGPGSGGSDSTTSNSTGTSTSSSSTGGGQVCRDVAPADRDRFVVVGLPYGDGDYVTDYEVLRLTMAGTLEATGHRFQMGSAEGGTIAMTPDGRVGVVAQREGTLGIFSLAEDGTPTVIDAAFAPGDFYGSAVFMAPSGDHVLALNEGWPDVGGGFYRIDLDCDTGEPTLVGRVAETKNAYGALHLGGDRWAVAGRGALGVEDGTDVHDLREAEPWTRTGGTDAFPYADSMPQGFARSADASFLLVGDYSEFASVDNNVRFVSVGADGFSAQGAALDILDPYAIAIAPEGDVALVASGYGDAIFVVDVDPTAATPLSLRGELDYATQPAQLPGPFVSVDRGALAGLVINVDIEGLRVIRFLGGGEVEDQGLFVVGDGVAGLVSAIGVQP